LATLPEEAAAATSTSHVRRLPRSTALTIVCATCFWLSIVWALGTGQVLAGSRPSDRLTRNFEIWETKPVRDHLFLGWLDPQQFDERRAYTNHLHPYLFFMYASAKAVQLATGVPLRVGVNATPFILMAIGVWAFAFALTSWRTIDVRGGPVYHLTLALAVGLLVVEWHYWSYLYTTNLDSIFPLVVFFALFVWSAAMRANDGGSSRPLVFWAAVFGAFGWIYVPLLVVALWCYFGRADSSGRWSVAANAAIARASAASCTCWIVAYSVPRVLVWLKGYSSASSSFMFRTGLDGDPRYFQGIAQAVFRPVCCPPRSLWNLLFPAFAALIAYAIWALWNGQRNRQVWAAFLFLSAPYFLSVAVIPQAVAIHPYLFDQLLFLPAALVGGLTALSAVVQARLSGPTLLAFLLLAAAIIMTNLIQIAQTMRGVLAG
jgi:hypothetical protein